MEDNINIWNNILRVPNFEWKIMSFNLVNEHRMNIWKKEPQPHIMIGKSKYVNKIHKYEKNMNLQGKVWTSENTITRYNIHVLSVDTTYRNM